MSKFAEITVEENGGSFERQEKVYLAAKKHFPIGQVQEYHIVDANPMRQLFKGMKPACISWDAKFGHTREGEWKDEHDCSECKYKKGVEEEGEKELVKCKLMLALSMEHEDPDKVYELKIPYGSYIEFSKYVKTLHGQGVDVPDVMTKITRIENPDGPGTKYVFERGDDYVGSGDGDEDVEAEVELTAAESAALDSLKAKIKKLGEPMAVEFAAGLLTKTKSVEGISNERALAVVSTIAVDGFIE